MTGPDNVDRLLDEADEIERISASRRRICKRLGLFFIAFAAAVVIAFVHQHFIRGNS